MKLTSEEKCLWFFSVVGIQATIVLGYLDAKHFYLEHSKWCLVNVCVYLLNLMGLIILVGVLLNKLNRNTIFLYKILIISGLIGAAVMTIMVIISYFYFHILMPDLLAKFFISFLALDGLFIKAIYNQRIKLALSN